MLAQLAAMRQENATLRQRLAMMEMAAPAAPGAPFSAVRPATPPHDPMDLPPPPSSRPPLFPDEEPSMEPAGEKREPVPGASPDPKRKGPVRALVVGQSNDQ